ncbi:MAG: T9SS type A sorting domain-containing protein, partial [Fibrobacteres bacterium]|nr:T9SS type A sorting domain-containing protein [Fibrobacterota bacterium]
ILNLSQQILSSVKVKTTSKSSLITVSRSEIAVPSIAAETAKKMDTLAVIKGTIDPSIVERTATAIDAVDKRVGFIKVGFTGGGVDTAKEHLIQVNIIDTIIDIDSTNIKVFDGSTQSLTVFKANRFGGRNYTESISINEGTGNGNGKIETGETFSLWFRLSEHLDPGSVGTWHPVVPVSGQNKPGIMYKGCRNYPLDITRNVLSAQMALTRTISVQQPFEVIFKAVIMKSYPATTYVRETEGRSYQKERYYRVRFPLSLSIGAEKKVTDNSNNSKITISPNPFNPAAVISFTLSGKEPKNANISVISAAGSCIRTFDQKELVLSGNGYHFSWDGKDSSGKAVSAGVYVIQITSEGKKLESKAVFVK